MSHKSRRTETLQTKQQAAARTVSALAGKSMTTKAAQRAQAASTRPDAAEIASASSGAWVSLRLSKTDDERIAQEYVARGWVKSQADILQRLSAAQRSNLKRMIEKAQHDDEPASAWANLPVTTAETH